MLRGAIYGLTAAAIWGGMYVVSDIVLRTIPPFTLLNLRLVLGLVVLAGLIVWRGAPASPWGQRLAWLSVGVIGFGLSLGAQFIGTDLSTAVNGALVTSASPAFIVLFAWLLLRERLTPTRLLAVLLATVGVIIIVDPASADFSSATFAGDVFLALAALTWGLYSVLVRRVSVARPGLPPADTLVLTAWAFVGGLIFTLPAGMVELAQRPVGLVDAGTVIGVLYLGIISTALAMWLWNRAFALVDASIASLFFFGQPLTGALLGAIFLGQPMTAALWAGSLLIAAGVLLSLRSR
ncbi:MAG: DMT family transporter [Anaerolineae bacterium]|jgi:drug/metabolite transporter (DMT)-like permease|nr:DMT family transporter [Anaerolineae bacterium]